jgi:hypothetical protein
MPYTHRHAKGRVNGQRRFVRARKRTQSAPRLTDEEREFIRGEIRRGLKAHEVVRMFFRRFNRDLSKTTVYHMMKEGDNG